MTTLQLAIGKFLEPSRIIFPWNLLKSYPLAVTSLYTLLFKKAFVPTKAQPPHHRKSQVPCNYTRFISHFKWFQGSSNSRYYLSVSKGKNAFHDKSHSKRRRCRRQSYLWLVLPWHNNSEDIIEVPSHKEKRNTTIYLMVINFGKKEEKTEAALIRFTL